MAQIDATGLGFGFNAAQIESVAYAGSGGYDNTYFSWVTATAAPFYRITAFSNAGNILFPPPQGTIDAITITNDTYASGLNITGLNVSLAALLNTVDAAANHEKFWETVLAGGTTVYVPGGPVNFGMMGDFTIVNAGQTLTGAADRFIGTANSVAQNSLTGDALNVKIGATLTGGADTFDNIVYGTIIGDVGDPYTAPPDGDNLGTLNGGADRITLNDTSANPRSRLTTVMGDVLVNSGITNGGADVITLRNGDGAGFVGGESQTNRGFSKGGADTIVLETNVAGRSYGSYTFVAGDDVYVQGSSAQTMGGADTITLSNVYAGYLSGDVTEVTGGASLTGGNDTITYRGSFALTTPASDYIDVNAQYVTGDAYYTSGTGSITGGDDTIRLTNVRAIAISGDVISSFSSGAFTGGDDFISVVYSRAAGSPLFSIYGDGQSSATRNFTGGNDTLTLNVEAVTASGTSELVGDLRGLITDQSVTVRNGDDVLTLISNAQQSGTLYGDGNDVNGGAAASVTIYDGDDRLTGGGGNDTLYGDTITATIPGGGGAINLTGGNDILDGRGGNDQLAGGLGIDTAVFGLEQSVYVNLNGIAGTAAAPADWIEAIGQGNDQLVGIENVTGSSLGDTIIGNAQANVFNGMGGADTMSGGAGNDTYYVDVAGDVTTEASGQGTDLVVSTVSRTLGANLENLTLGGTAIIDGNGNALANIITGNAAANIIRGYDGLDTLVGNAGGDLLIGGNARDVLKPGVDTSRDTLKFATVVESTGAARDIVYDMDLNGEDRFDFVAIPTAIRTTISAGALDSASFDANLAAAIGAGQMGAGQAVLFDPNAGNLNQAGHLYLVVDANGVAGYQAGADHVVELFNAVGTLTLDDFI